MPASGGTPGDDFALAERATALAPVIAAEIVAAGGAITFHRFMALALGHPAHGYYARERLRWGAQGDYESSPEVHPIFGYMWARQVLECWQRLGEPPQFALIEPGAGSGAFAVALLGWLRDRAPDCFAAARPLLLDAHPRRIEEQRSALANAGLQATHGLLQDWLDERQPVTAVVVSNELFDAFPVHLVERRDGRLQEWHVRGTERDGFALSLQEPSTPALEAHFERLGVLPGAGCRAEVSFEAMEAMEAIAARIDRGYILTLDYGYEAEQLYAPWRRMGTLMAFRNHSPQPDPLASPGLLDLTCHVDFSALAAAGRTAGFAAASIVSQAEALTALGIGEALAAARERMGENIERYAADRAAVDTLLEPAGLGRVRVLVQASGASLEGLRCLAPVAT